MKPLVWKTAPPRIDERASGFPALLLILLMLHVLKPAPGSPPSPVFPCRAPLYVQVEGEVRNPGVYPFCGEPRVEEVIRRAGGVRKSCDSFEPPRTTTVTSGQKVLVIRDEPKCEVWLGEMWAYYKISLSIPLSVNRESQEGLTAIPGIGFKLAGAIVRARENRGGFKTLDEIATVPGVGKALYGKIKPYLIL
jgi:competence protein ComEA